MNNGIFARVQHAYRDRHGVEGYRMLSHDLFAIMRHGYVLHTPLACLMGFQCWEGAVRAAADRGDTITAREHADQGGDCWFVWFALGDLREVIRLIPFDLKSVAFSRRDVLRVWKFEEITRLSNALAFPNLASR